MSFEKNPLIRPLMDGPAQGDISSYCWNHCCGVDGFPDDSDSDYDSDSCQIYRLRPTPTPNPNPNPQPAFDGWQVLNLVTWRRAAGGGQQCAPPSAAGDGRPLLHRRQENMHHDGGPAGLSATAAVHTAHCTVQTAPGDRGATAVML